MRVVIYENGNMGKRGIGHELSGAAARTGGLRKKERRNY